MGEASRRPLIEGERALAEATFGKLDFDRVRLRNGAGFNPFAKIAFLFKGVDAVTLVRTIFFKNKYAADFSEPGADRGLFLHEMTHIWQYQKLGVLRFGLRYLKDLVRHRFNRDALYKYGAKDAFPTATLEAQAQMVQERAANLAGSGLYGL